MPLFSHKDTSPVCSGTGFSGLLEPLRTIPSSLRRLLARGSGSLLACCLLFGAAGHAQAAEFYAIIANLNDAKDPHAQLDVSMDTFAYPGSGWSVPVPFYVFGADGVQLAAFEVVAHERGFGGFASSSGAAAPNDNLFTASGGLPALVAAVTPDRAPSAATLRLIMEKSTTVVSLPRARRSDGTGLAMGTQVEAAIGEIDRRATLLIANVSGSDVAVDVFFGSKGAPGGGYYNNPRLQNLALWILDLDPSDANKHMVVTSTGNIIVQLAVVAGKDDTVTETTLLPH